MRMSTNNGNDKLVLINSTSFENYKNIGDPVSQAKIYQAQVADELIFLNIDKNVQKNAGALIQVIKKTAEQIFMPITVGGGITSLDYMRELLLSGADKISINTGAIENMDLVNNAANFFGNQCIVVSIDYAKRKKDGKYRVYISGGSEETKWDPISWAQKVEELGAGEILLTSIDMDGSREGLDIEMTRLISNAVSIPVITSGGCGKATHFIEGFRNGGADAIAAGTFFSSKDQNPIQTRAQILNAGISVRVHT